MSKPDTLDRGPIFIGGPDRCGKTTMRAFLASHPNISIPAVGSNMWTYFYGQYGDLRRGDNFERCLDAMLHYKHVRFLNPDPERIRREFWQGEPTYGRLFALFLMHHAEREGKPRWGAQTGLIERYADHVFEAYPTAKLVHMLRDPRDRYEASLALWPDGKGRAGGATARWNYSARLATRNRQRYPARYMVVRYESMVTEPEDTIRQVCAFLGETYVPEMLAMTGAPEHVEKMTKGGRLVDPAHPLSEEYIGLYRGRIPKNELAFMQMYAREEMLRYDYAPEPIDLSGSERLRFVAIDWPLNLGRMAAWSGLETIQHRLPGIVGRKPSRKMIIKQNERSRPTIETA